MNALAQKLLEWYDRHARVLPWRGHPDPYAVWVSEMMLQQTQVTTVIPYFERWMARFPTVADLAAADEKDVLSLWEGLGYYSRARNLHRAARLIMSEFGGQIPDNLSDLRRLPGVGRYTAAAIASMAFGQDVATLDGNLRRVFARLFDVTEPADSAAGENQLWQLVEAHLPPGRAGDYNQALMDLGATICLPRNPTCLLCPLQEMCLARARGVVAQRPVLKPRPVTPHHHQVAAVVVRDGAVLLARRPAQGLLGGLWEFPNARIDSTASPAAILPESIRAACGLDVAVVRPLALVRHAYTHFKLTVHPFVCTLESDALPAPWQWAPLTALQEFPMGKVDRQVARQVVEQDGYPDPG
ncbi:MAG: A/G-specific adenine glycosylase [Anaerolineales bacterium]